MNGGRGDGSSDRFIGGRRRKHFFNAAAKHVIVEVMWVGILEELETPEQSSIRSVHLSQQIEQLYFLLDMGI